jgi:hypothetical protein
MGIIADFSNKLNKYNNTTARTNLNLIKKIFEIISVPGLKLLLRL